MGPSSFKEAENADGTDNLLRDKESDTQELFSSSKLKGI